MLLSVLCMYSCYVLFKLIVVVRQNKLTIVAIPLTSPIRIKLYHRNKSLNLIIKNVQNYTYIRIR